MQPPCPHLSHLDRAAGLRCGCGETLTFTPPRLHRATRIRRRIRGIARMLGPWVTVIVAFIILGLITAAIERI